MKSNIDYKQEHQAWKGMTEKQKRQVTKMTDNFTMVDGTPYDPETGENLSGKIHVQPVITETQREGVHIKENLRQHEDDNGGFVFVFFREMQTLNKRFPSLTRQDIARLMFIGTYVSYDEEDEASHGYLRHGGNGVVINKKSLRELVGMSKNKFNEYYNRLSNEGIIAEKEEGIAVNPAVFYRGKNLDGVKGDMQHTRLFRKTVRDLYGKFSGRSVSKLGVIYEILPYINFNYNIVCENPTQVREDEIEPMKLKDLAARIGYKEHRRLIEVMREVTYNDKPVFKFVDDGRDKRMSYVIVNPNVVYAGNGKHLSAIKMLFK